MLIKVCGLNNRDNIFAISKMEINLMGFIFYKNSPRYFNNALSFDEARQIPKHIKKVGVFVNEPIYSVFNSIAHYDLDFVQLHGEESIDYCRDLLSSVKIIKTISIKDKNSILKIQNYSDVCDYFLFDTSTPNYGGSGQAFNWHLLSDTIINKPFFISGGVSLDNVSELKNLSIKNLIGLDVNSKFEINPGLKDLEKIQQLLKK
ncbi:MAG: phosphoribosylanthranilate isomerase [Bacteroidota bacterium]|nr:phosphoribosylanthranilate isomerase [Bacteroidota bacterium]